MYNYQSLAATDISEVTRPRSAGKLVDTRVVHAPAEPKPDYDRMREIVHGRDATRQSVSKPDDGQHDE